MQKNEPFLEEGRLFPPSEEFQARAYVRDFTLHNEAEKDRLEYWAKWALQLKWFSPFRQILEWNRPYAKWFLGGKINACFNCLDLHVNEGRGHRVAWIAEGEPGDVRTFTYDDALRLVQDVALALKHLGVEKGDRVCIYMPMGPELTATMLACARIGAVHSVIFGGFSAESIHERINDAGAKVVVTADGSWRRGNVIPLKSITDQALAMGCPTIQKVLVYQRVGLPGEERHGKEVPAYNQGDWVEGRDHWWHDVLGIVTGDCPCEPMDSEDLLFILYTSGSTGKPKGIMHTTGGYMTGAFSSSKIVFDYHPSDVYWCTADCGWITGHTYVVYGPMANCVTQVLYEGAPDTPDKDRFWKIIEQHKVSILYTAPTAIRTFMKWGDKYPLSCDLSSLRLLGSVGEPINPEAWMWYRETIGGGECPVVDTWWQTETGSIMISPIPGLTTTKPGSATFPLPGVMVKILDEEGNDLTREWEHGKEVDGMLVLTEPWPSMLRGIWGDPERYEKTYWQKFGHSYFAGDGVKKDSDGYLWLLGRVDDIMLVSGHNVSTMEVESALVDHPAVAESAVIGKAHEIKGQSVCAFVTLRSGYHTTPDLADELKKHVSKKIGALARPDDLFFTADLPKTRSGKIMRRLLRDIAEGRALGDTTTLADPGVVASLKDQYEDKEG